jgi:uncharacterized metal-binding protein YceD (DUF177 family)
VIPDNFQIEVFSLPFGYHHFEFKADELFLNTYGNTCFEKASIVANFTINKKNLIQEADIHIQASVSLNCNRCNISNQYEVFSSHHVVIKKGNPADSNEEIIFAHEDDEFVDFSQFVYDTILTNLPARYVPCEISAAVECDKEILNKLQNIELFEEPQEYSSEQFHTLGELNPEFFKKLSNHFKN